MILNLLVKNKNVCNLWWVFSYFDWTISPSCRSVATFNMIVLDLFPTYLDNIETPTLSIEEKNFCDSDLTIDECYDTLNTFSANKTPGNDGLSVEF